jgi:stage II sporulation protein D
MSKFINRFVINRFSARTLLVGVLLTLVYPLAAQASVSWVVHGRGFGHGVGMSAYGAYGYAEQGKGYRFILGHYYTGTSLETLEKTRVVRVLLDISPGEVEFSGATSACGEALDPRRSYEAHRNGGSVVLRSSGGKRLAG